MNTVDPVTKESWDPLDDYPADPGVFSSAQKREIANILRSYTGYYDLFAELIQNALDAVERRIAESEEDYEPVIWTTIDIQKGKVTVTDNGCGMNESEFRQFLRPNFSFKDASLNRGNKGVGATYLAYGFNYLEIATKTHDRMYSGVIRNGRAWVEDPKNSLARPRVQIVDPTDEHFVSIDRGSSMTVKLEGESIRPNDLSWVGATTAEQWLAILRVHSALGGVYICQEEPSQITAVIKVVDSDGESTQSSLSAPKFLYPACETKSVADIREFLADQKKRVEQGLDVSVIPPKFRQLNGIWGEWSGEEIIDSTIACPISARNLSDTEKHLALTLGLSIHVFLGYSTSLWDNFNDDVIGLRKGYRLLRGGIQLSTRNMPQGSLITIPMTSNIGLQHQAHVLIHLKNAEPDLGRKGFQPDVVRIAERLSVSAVNALRRHMKLLRKPGSASLFSEEFELDNWKNDQLAHEENSPLIISGTGLFMPTEELPIRSEPLVEQDVVALFNQMLSSGLIRGIQLISSSQHKQYDALYRIHMKEPFERFIISPTSNPLGITDEHFHEKKPLQSSIKVLEYKHTVDGLIEELQSEMKAEEDIDLVVAWELGAKWIEHFDVMSYLDSENVHLREMHGVTHEFTNSTSGRPAFRAIILKDLIRYLADPEKEEACQRVKLMPYS